MHVNKVHIMKLPRSMHGPALYDRIGHSLAAHEKGIVRGVCTGGGLSAPRLSIARGRAVPAAKPSCRQATSASTGSKLDAHTAPNTPSWKTWRAPVTKPLISNLSTILRSPSARRQACHTEKATEARHRPERQYNACNSRSKQCRPNETQAISNTTHPRRGHNNPTNSHTPSRIKSTHTRRTYTGMRPHAPGLPADRHVVFAHIFSVMPVCVSIWIISA